VRARDNPFATHRVRRVRYRLQGQTWAGLLDRLGQLDYRAAIVGPKGAGKTTLLEDLAPRLAAIGFTPQPLRLDAEHRRFAAPFERAFFARLDPRDCILLDGAEQMSWWRWRRFCQRSRKGGGLIITSHRPGLLPTWLDCRPTPELLDEVLLELLGAAAAAWQGLARQLFHRHCGNLREVLRDLYDEFAA
jgi:hypothetical protein